MTLREIADYYVDRLILQYRDRPKARATVAIAVKQALGDYLAGSLVTCFDVDAAVGAQLDAIGLYVGVPRNIGTALAQGYFGLWTYASALDPAEYQGTWDPASDSPTLPDPTTVPNAWYVASAAGTSTSPYVADDFLAGDVVFSDGATWAKRTADNGNGLTTYNDPASNAAGIFYSYSTAARSATALTDASFRTVLKLRIILNSNDGTLGTIVALLKQFFGPAITVIDNKDMTMSYTVYSTVPLSRDLLLAYLPKPMGVGISVTIVSPSPGGGDSLVTEGGDTLVTEGGDTITTEPT